MSAVREEQGRNDYVLPSFHLVILSLLRYSPLHSLFWGVTFSGVMEISILALFAYCVGLAY
jgi:hypothetical protein